MTATWYSCRLLSDHPPFIAGEHVCVRQAGDGFDVCTDAGQHLTHLDATTAKLVLKSERDAEGYPVRVAAPGVLEMRIQRAGMGIPVPAVELAARAGKPVDVAALMGMADKKRAPAGHVKPQPQGRLVAWQCWACGHRVPWAIKEPWACPACGCTLWNGVYG